MIKDSLYYLCSSYVRVMCNFSLLPAWRLLATFFFSIDIFSLRSGLLSLEWIWQFSSSFNGILSTFILDQRFLTFYFFFFLARKQLWTPFLSPEQHWSPYDFLNLINSFDGIWAPKIPYVDMMGVHGPHLYVFILFSVNLVPVQFPHSFNLLVFRKTESFSSIFLIPDKEPLP